MEKLEELKDFCSATTFGYEIVMMLVEHVFQVSDAELCDDFAPNNTASSTASAESRKQTD